MNSSKRRRLEAQGWRLGTTQEFLGLPEDDAAYIELKLRLANILHDLRREYKLTQVAVAALLESSQSRVAKMEAGDPSVSVDLLIRSVLKLGANVGLAQANVGFAQTILARFMTPAHEQSGPSVSPRCTESDRLGGHAGRTLARHPPRPVER